MKERVKEKLENEREREMSVREVSWFERERERELEN